MVTVMSRFLFFFKTIDQTYMSPPAAGGGGGDTFETVMSTVSEPDFPRSSTTVSVTLVVPSGSVSWACGEGPPVLTPSPDHE